MPKKTQFFYYKIYDDKEQYNYFKTTFEQRAVRKLLSKFEKTHQQYYTAEFMESLRDKDPKAELIEVTPISY